MRRTLAAAAGAAAVVSARRLRRAGSAGPAESLLEGLEAPVEVLRDRYGIPHVFAGGLADAARAQGWIHAHDRLLQMELSRRFASGRLSELFGVRTLELDRTVRRLRLRSIAERDEAAADPETTGILAAYCEGVNAALPRVRLPVELRLLRCRPDPWTPLDVHAAGAVLTYTLSGNWEGELVRMRLAARLGEERARRLDPAYPEHLPVIVPAALAASAERRAAWLRRLVGTGASNNWAIAGSRTASGAPILANDPHLVLGMPVLWHLQHLSWDGGAAVGATLPGVPGIILGRNEDVAWGMTTAMLDTQDLYLERLDPDDPRRYRVDGRWEEAVHTREEIRVRGRRQPVVEEVLATRHGPIVARAPSGEALALRWSAYEPGESARALLDVLRASSADEVDSALDRFAAPPHNFVFADRHGTIAYRLAGGPVPRRAPGEGLVPVPGWTSDHEWDGYIPESELPRARDPERGFLVTANNRVAGDGYPHALAAEFLNGYRAERIETRLAELDAATVEDCRRLQLDLLSLPGLELARIARGFGANDPLEQAALDALAAWDGELTVESPGGAVYGVLVRCLFAHAYAEALPHVLEPFGEGAVSGPSVSGLYERSRPLLLELLAGRDDSFFGDGRTWEEVFGAALADTVRELGPEPARWRWGDHHRFTIDHALSGLPGVGRRLRRGPYPAGGDADTVFPIASLSGRPEGPWAGPTYRAVHDLGDPDENYLVVATGESGDPLSRHYDDLLPLWREGGLVRVPVRREAVEPLAAEREVLRPRE